MKRFFYLRFFYFIVLMMLSSSAYAGHTYSFVVGRHRVYIEAPRHCHSPSCLSVSIPEIRETLDRYDNTEAATAVPANSLAPAPEAVSPRPGVTPAVKPSIEPVASVATPHVGLAAATTREVAVPAPSNIQPSRPQPTTPTPPSTQPSTDIARPAADTAARISRIVREGDDATAETPLGDWQTEGSKGSVRIERCGRALCGHILNPSSSDNGEIVLINMKPKTAALWSGNIYSRDSENTYYATIAMKGPYLLRVEACALGRFFCSGKVWSRIGGKPEKLVISRQTSPEPRS
jgi:uncharacterized protein (DUF2147 family)